MIIGNIGQIELEKTWLPQTIFTLLQRALAMDPLHMEPGSYTLGKGHYMNIDDVVTKPESECLYEAHQEYADIQVVLSGAEEILCAPILEVGTHMEDRSHGDAYFYDWNGPATRIPMTTGTYAVFFPGDAHKTLIAPDGCGARVKKMIIKVRLNHM